MDPTNHQGNFGYFGQGNFPYQNPYPNMAHPSQFQRPPFLPPPPQGWLQPPQGRPFLGAPPRLPLPVGPVVPALLRSPVGPEVPAIITETTILSITTRHGTVPIGDPQTTSTPATLQSVGCNFRVTAKPYTQTPLQGVPHLVGPHAGNRLRGGPVNYPRPSVPSARPPAVGSPAASRALQVSKFAKDCISKSEASPSPLIESTPALPAPLEERVAAVAAPALEQHSQLEPAPVDAAVSESAPQLTKSQLKKQRIKLEKAQALASAAAVPPAEVDQKPSSIERAEIVAQPLFAAAGLSSVADAPVVESDRSEESKSDTAVAAADPKGPKKKKTKPPVSVAAVTPTPAPEPAPVAAAGAPVKQEKVVTCQFLFNKHSTAKSKNIIYAPGTMLKLKDEWLSVAEDPLANNLLNVIIALHLRHPEISQLKENLRFLVDKLIEKYPLEKKGKKDDNMASVMSTIEKFISIEMDQVDVAWVLKTLSIIQDKYSDFAAETIKNIVNLLIRCEDKYKFLVVLLNGLKEKDICYAVMFNIFNWLTLIWGENKGPGLKEPECQLVTDIFLGLIEKFVKLPNPNKNDLTMMLNSLYSFDYKSGSDIGLYDIKPLQRRVEDRLQLCRSLRVSTQIDENLSDISADDKHVFAIQCVVHHNKAYSHMYENLRELIKIKNSQDFPGNWINLIKNAYWQLDLLNKFYDGSNITTQHINTPVGDKEISPAEVILVAINLLRYCQPNLTPESLELQETLKSLAKQVLAQSSKEDCSTNYQIYITGIIRMLIRENTGHSIDSSRAELIDLFKSREEDSILVVEEMYKGIVKKRECSLDMLERFKKLVDLFPVFNARVNYVSNEVQFLIDDKLASVEAASAGGVGVPLDD